MMKPAPSGVTGDRSDDQMTTQTQSIRAVGAGTLLSVLAAAFLGLSLIIVAGHVQAGALHDAAHDMRHATGFPCH